LYEGPDGIPEGFWYALPTAVGPPRFILNCFRVLGSLSGLATGMAEAKVAKRKIVHKRMIICLNMTAWRVIGR